MGSLPTTGVVGLVLLLGCASERYDPEDPSAGAACAEAACSVEGDGGSPRAGTSGGGVDAGAGGAGSAGDAAPAEGAPGGRLVSTAELEAMLDDVSVFDVRSAADFATAHVPGATPLPAGSLRAEVNGVPGQAPPVDALAGVLGGVGVAREVPAIVYGAASDLSTARVLWTLEYTGHADVRMLDGGLVEWTAAGLATEAGDADAPAGTELSVDGFDLDRRVDVAWMLEHLDDPDVVLVDARSAGEYEAGHIPGAVSLDWPMNLAGSVLKPLPELETLYEDIPRSATVVAYCQTGSRAAMVYFALRHLGYPDVRLYDGSMAEWTQDPARPLE